MKELEEYAKINNIPIMQKDGILYLINYIKENNIKNILEIGSAIGYSSIMMASINSDIRITTIERDKDRYDLAVSNIKKYNLDKQINIIYGDAVDTDIAGMYDLIFIDAAKGKNIFFFEKYKNNLEQFYYDKNKQELRIHDLMRYGIEAVLLNDYKQIPDILTDIQRETKCNTIFISGAAHEYGSAWKNSAPQFIRSLVRELYRKHYKIITGHARGIGSYVISAVVEECQNNVSKLEKHLMIKAFPYEDKNRTDYKKLVTSYREGIFKHAGIVIFMFGNKISENGVILTDGVYQEFEIAKKSNAYIIPIGSTAM